MGPFSVSGSPLRSLKLTERLLQRSFERLSTQLRINRASDDPAGLAIAEGLKSEVRGLEQGSRNITAAAGFLSTAEGGYSAQLESLQRMREIAVQAANGTLSNSDRENLDKEFQQLKASVDDIATQTEFNGQPVIDGSFESLGVSVQTGAQAGQSVSVKLTGTTAEQLEISTLDITSQENAEDALASIDSAIESVIAAQSAAGAGANALNTRLEVNSRAVENLSEARSRLEDLDLAAEISENQRLKTLREAQILAAKKTNDLQKKGGLIDLLK